MKKKDKHITSVSLDEKIINEMEKHKINRSKLVNYLIEKFLKSNKNIEKFKRKS